MGTPWWDYWWVDRWGWAWNYCCDDAAVDDRGGESRRALCCGCRRRDLCGVVVDLRHALLEDVAEALEVVEIGGAEVLRHAAFDFL